MRYFVRSIFKFFVLNIVLLSLLIYSTLCFLDGKVDFDIDDSISNAFFGNSHIECSINDSLVNNARNFGQSGEAYFYTYIKMKKILLNNRNIKNVFVEFTNSQIDSKMDEWIGSDFFMSAKMPIYFPFMNKEDMKFLNEISPKVFRNNLLQTLKLNLLKILVGDFDYLNSMGGWTSLNSSMKSEPNYYVSNIKKLESGQNMNYLKKIISLCNENGVKLFLIRSPQHVSYEYLQNESQFEEIYDRNFHEVEFLDFNDFPLNDNKFADRGHLNSEGSMEFSTFLNYLIKANLLIGNNKQARIDMEIEKIKLNYNLEKFVGLYSVCL